MRRSLSILSRISLVLAAVVFPMAAIAADDVGKLTGNGSGMEWSLTRAGHSAVILTVEAPDGTLYQKAFPGAQNPTFRVSDLKKACVDGTYTYQLRVVPQVSGAAKAALAAARRNGQEATEILEAYGLDREVVQSGAFGMLDCAFLDPNATESAARKANVPASVSSDARKPADVSSDTTFIDDVYAKMSLCVGPDCSELEGFGNDTIRMKENIIRFHFDDSSTAPGFPANDWRLTANDTGSGGASYFSIDDASLGQSILKIEAGALANNIYVDSSGHVGINQSNPGLDLTMTTGDTPGVRFDQNGSSGFAAQTWDVAGNEANFFIRDVTGGSKLPFRIKPGAPTNSLYVDAAGNIGLGTSSPSHPLHHAGGAHLTAGGVWTNASSRALKQNITRISAAVAMATLRDLQPVTYQYKVTPGDTHAGFIAEDVPEIVATPDRKGIAAMDVVAVLTKVVKEQQATIEELKARLEKLEQQQ